MPRIALCAIDPLVVTGRYNPFSLGIRQLQATIALSPQLADWEVVPVDSQTLHAEEWLQQILDIKPDVVGFSAFVWSFPVFVQVAQRLRQLAPKMRLILGGPCARPVMFTLPRYQGHEFLFDAVVAGEGEWVLPALLGQSAWNPQELQQLPGVHVPARSGWLSGPVAEPDRPLDELASAILSHLVDFKRTVSVERYRGCPMSCAFCQWGDWTVPHRVFGEERMRLELQTLKDQGTTSIQLVDAGLNLNTRAFKNFKQADAEVGLMKMATLHACVYPSYLTDEHLEFISQCHRPVLDLGVQSFTQSALDAMGRPFRLERFERVVAELTRISKVEAELILGLPGDNPEAFKQGVLKLLEMNCKLRVFHCLVLPDALMSRQTPAHKLVFDPETFRVTSCLGWSEQDLHETRAWLEDLTVRVGGDAFDNMWAFYNAEEAASAISLQIQPVLEFLPEMQQHLAPLVHEATAGAWALTEVGHARRSMRTRLTGKDLELQLDFVPLRDGAQHYRSGHGVAVSYRVLNDAPMLGTRLQQLDALVAAMLPRVAPHVLEKTALKPQVQEQPIRAQVLQIQAEIPRLSAPSFAVFHAAWERAHALVLEQLLPVDVCQALVRTLNTHVERAAEQEKTQPISEQFAERLRLSGQTVLPFWDPQLPATLPPVERLQRLGHQLQQIPEVAALLRQPAVLNVLHALVANPLLVNAVLIDKVPNGTTEFGLHQDSWYLLSEPDTLISLQIALDECDDDNGCLRLVPTGLPDPPACRAELTPSGWRQTAQVLDPPVNSAALAVPLRVGSVLVYSGRTWHASARNRSSRHRRVLVAQFIAADSAWSEENWLRAPEGGFSPWK